MGKLKSLLNRRCEHCGPDARPLSKRQVKIFLSQIDRSWVLSAKARKIKKVFKFKNFSDALKLANRIGRLAERENHHPDLVVAWGSLTVEIWTHSAGGLTDNDFILAAKIDHLIRS